MIRWLKTHKIILMLCLITTVARFSLDSYLPSLPAIGQAFAVSEQQAQWTLTSYLIGFGCSQLIYGPISDRFGRRIILLLSFIIFICGSLLCVFSHSINMLLWSRLIAGLGAGASGVLNRAIASDNFQGNAFAKAWSYTTATLMLTLIFAPLIGGYVEIYFGWRGNFYLATIYIAFIAIAVAAFLPETNKHINRRALLPKVFLHNYGEIICHRAFVVGVLCYIFAFAGLIAYFQVSPFLFINAMGFSPSSYGWTSLAIAAGYLIGGVLVNQYTKEMGITRMLFLGMLLLAAGGILMWLGYLISGLNPVAILLPAMVYVVGARIVIPSAMASALKHFPNKAGSASAVTGSMQILGTAVISLMVAGCCHRDQLALAITLILLGVSSIIIFTCLRIHRRYIRFHGKIFFKRFL